MAMPSDKYTSDDYITQNPNWDMEDSPWKAARVNKIISNNKLKLKKVCEVGCGAGGILVNLKDMNPDISFIGYDIAPAAAVFWKTNKQVGIDFQLGDFFELDSSHYDAILLLDVLEHIVDPHQFLLDMKDRTSFLIIHFPLDLSAFSVLREQPLLHVRRKVGHIHYFTKNLALELLRECGIEVLDWMYTGASTSAPQRNLKSKLFSIVRSLAYAINKDAGVRLFGGETIMVLARFEQ